MSVGHQVEGLQAPDVEETLEDRHVAGDRGVGLGRPGAFREPIPEQVEDVRLAARPDELRDDVAPDVRRGRSAVYEHDRLAGAMHTVGDPEPGDDRAAFEERVAVKEAHRPETRAEMKSVSTSG
jgi:hypothetical protein